MRLLLFIGFSFFCFDQVILMSTGRTENENIPGEILESKKFQLCDEMDHKTELMDLNDDCQLKVLEKLDFNSLFFVAGTNRRYKSLVGETMKSIFRRKMLVFTFLSPSPIKWPGIFVGEDLIKIQYPSIARVILTLFGHHIQKLQISYDRSNPIELMKHIYRLVNLYCSKTLREITLYHSPANFLDEFTNTFENVQNVKIQYNLETNRRLNEVFPSVRQLDIQIFKIPHPGFINDKYKHLKHLGISVFPFGGILEEQWVTELFTKNSHIRSLKLEKSSAKYIKIAANSIPQLEKLDLDYMQSNYNETINLGSVKELVVNGSHVDKLYRNVKFGNVEEVTLYFLPESLFGETGFLRSNEHLKILKLPTGWTIVNDNELEKLARTKTTIQHIFIDDAQHFKVQTFLVLINNNSQLERVELAFSESRQKQKASKALRETISDEWSIEEFENNLILKKKKTTP